MSRFELTDDAIADLEEIVDFVEFDANEERARVVLDALLHAMAMLADAPGIGHRRRDLAAEDVRFWSVFDWLIVYDWQSQPIVIVRIIHGRRGPSAFDLS